jgi:hypothetical protein
LRRRRKWKLRIGLATVLAVIVGTGGYVYAAGNTVATTYAGDGSQGISGYTVTSLLYNLNQNSPRNVDSVQFTLTPTTTAPATVKVQLAAGGSWYSCAIGGGNAITCATTAPQATATGSTQLTVVAAQ